MSEHADSHTHVLPVRVYVLNLIALMILMVVTIAAAQVDLGSWVNNILAMVIASTKAMLVINFFMHVKYGTRLIKVYAYVGFVWFFLLFGIWADYICRRYEPIPGWEIKDGGSATPREKRPPLDGEFFTNSRPR